jgi:hypothetical protein
MRYVKMLILPSLLCAVVAAAVSLVPAEPPYGDRVPAIPGEYRGPTVRELMQSQVIDGRLPESDLDATEE